jgi:large subunit ribosomal protein L29
MAKKIEKKEDLSVLSVGELEARLNELKDIYFQARFRHVTSPLKNPLEIRHFRRHIARIRTWLRQKEVHA